MHYCKWLIKGPNISYLRYWTITLQNVTSEAQVRNLFIFQKSYVPFLRYSSFCIFNHPMIYQICDVMMNISTQDRVHFCIYLLNHNSLSHQTWLTNRYKQGQYFSRIFWTIWRTEAIKPLPICYNYSVTNYVDFSVFQFFERVSKGQLKMVNVNYEKWTNLTMLPFY